MERYEYEIGWAIWAAYAASKVSKFPVLLKTQNVTFLSYMYPLLKTYHLWWYKNRDHNNNQLCEFGSTTGFPHLHQFTKLGTTQTAKWESGMDDAVRFNNMK